MSYDPDIDHPYTALFDKSLDPADDKDLDPVINHKVEFEQRSGYRVSRVEVNGEEELYFVEMIVGGYEDEEFYGLILDDGPAEGERYYL